MQRIWKGFVVTIIFLVILVWWVEWLASFNFQNPEITITENNLITKVPRYEAADFFFNQIKKVSNKDQTDDQRRKSLEKAITYSKRKNILLLGIEGKLRTDTIIFASFDSETKKLDIIFVPRDTYYHDKGCDRGDQRKINAKYSRGKEIGSIEAVEKILWEVPVHHYVSVEYEGVENIINVLGGVSVKVPCLMKVGGIQIPEGPQVLNGKQAMQFLRFRKKYPDGDLGRIKMQQQFLKSVIHKLEGSNIPVVVKASYHSIKTDMTLLELLTYGLQIKEVNKDHVSMKILPGAAKYKKVGDRSWSYFFHDSLKTKALIMEMYHVNQSKP